MNKWELAATILSVALLPCLGVCLLAGAAHGLAAFEVASTLGASVLLVLSAGFQRQPFVDLAITLAVLSIVGALAFARLMEHDL
ncbi:MAG: monovalent cation/H+ antiporter complex subunit F [Solirubrobacteraceae bacterium]